MRTRLDALFARDLAPQVRAGRDATVAIADLREDIAQGQSVARYKLRGLVAGSWRVLSQGTTIGYRKLDRFQPVGVSGVRLEIEEAVGPSQPVRVALH
jgi:alpha-L-fucosidase